MLSNNNKANNILKYRKIYFSGIGGISMSGLAEISHQMGAEVLGSDMTDSENLIRLKKLGVTVHIPQVEKNITPDIGLMVHTAAVKQDNPEIIAAKKLGIKTVERAEFLGLLMQCYKRPVCVSGTHGKTTITSMLAEVMLKTNFNPTITVGGVLESIGGNIRIGGEDVFLMEACEYCNSFLQFNPYAAIISNIEADHMDFFSNLDEIEQSFRAFAQKISPNGVLVINNSVKNLSKIVEGLACKVITFGENGDYSYENLRFESGFGAFDLLKGSQHIGSFKLSTPGMHNVENAMAAAALCHELGVPCEDILALNGFTGTKRRFEFKGKKNGATIVDDYAHHPTEVKVALSAAKSYDTGRLWCVFQPHTYTRTKVFLNEFANAFTDCDKIIITDIYAAREKDLGEVCAKDIADKIEQLGKEVYYISKFEDIIKFLKDNLTNNDMLITMGAGDVYLIGERLLLS